MGLLNSPSASAEIEGEESEMVCVDAPIAPERDLIAMLKQTRAIPNDLNHLQLKSFFISVDEERKMSTDSNGAIINDHIRELLHKYHGEEESKCNSRISISNWCAFKFHAKRICAICFCDRAKGQSE